MLDGISEKTTQEHLGLYQGYVKNFNTITKLAGELMSDPEKNGPAIAELMRRRSFEFGGMRLHELYFPQFESGAKEVNLDGALGSAITKQYGKIDYCIAEIKQVASLRGPGWSLLYWDPVAAQFLVGFTGEQHLGHFVTLPVILALDVWEHAFILDYGAQGKGKYIDAFFNNLNWEVVDNRFAEVRS